MCSISLKKRVKCSNSSCHFVYQFQDIIHPLVNDKGYVVFKCPNCGHCTKTKVNNTDIYVSNGIGTSTLKFRMFSVPSINFYRITKP